MFHCSLESSWLPEQHAGFKKDYAPRSSYDSVTFRTRSFWGRLEHWTYTKAATVATKNMKVTCSLVSYGSYIKMQNVTLGSVSSVKLITRVCEPSVHYLLICNLYNEAVRNPGYKASSPVQHFSIAPKTSPFLL
jgi:hypothetical protein